jgi:hypothetical protein
MRGVSANVNSCAHGAQVNFGDLTSYLTHRWEDTGMNPQSNNDSTFLRGIYLRKSSFFEVKATVSIDERECTVQ